VILILIISIWNSDNDGIIDNIEWQTTTLIMFYQRFDADGNGLANNCETFSGIGVPIRIHLTRICNPDYLDLDSRQ
jgi:hypothetical protein